jgi:hypothetical protein
MDNSTYQRQRKIASTIVILIGVIIIVALAVIFLGKKENTQLQTENDKNYTQSATGVKVNTSTDVSKDKTVNGVVLSSNTLVYEDGMTKLNSKVTNDATEKANLRFKVKFMDNDGNVMAESVGYVGQISANETKYIDSYITTDVVNAKDIVYEVIE